MRLRASRKDLRAEEDYLIVMLDVRTNTISTLYVPTKLVKDQPPGVVRIGSGCDKIRITTPIQYNNRYAGRNMKFQAMALPRGTHVCFRPTRQIKLFVLDTLNKRDKYCGGAPCPQEEGRFYRVTEHYSFRIVPRPISSLSEIPIQYPAL